MATDTLFISQADDIQKTILAACKIARQNAIPIVLVATSATLICLHVLKNLNKVPSGNSGSSNFRTGAFSRYEICSQVARSAFFAASCVTTALTYSNWVTSLMGGYLWALGVLRILCPARYRSLLLNHINCLVVIDLGLLLVSEFLPLTLMHTDRQPEPPKIVLVALLGVSALTALFTPRECATTQDLWDQRISGSVASPEESCSYFSYFISYGWLTNMVLRGMKGNLIISDLPSIPQYDEPLLWLSRIQQVRLRGGSTLWTLVVLFKKELTFMALYSAASAALQLIAPFAMFQLLAHLGAPEAAAIDPLVWVVLLFVGPLCGGIALGQYLFIATRLIVRIKLSLVQELFHVSLRRGENSAIHQSKKSQPSPLESSPASVSEKDPEITNLMSTDVDAIASARDLVLSCVAGPVSLVLSMTLLFRMLGWPSMAGLSVMVICLPVPTYISQQVARQSRRVMQATDERISMIAEFLPAIRTIKYFAWEDMVSKKIDDARDTEQALLWKRTLYAIGVTASAEIVPLLALLVMFSFYVATTNQRLTSSIAFTSLSLVEVIRLQFVLMSAVTSTVAKASSSFRRLDEYFESFCRLRRHPVGPPAFKNATLRASNASSFRLVDITLKFLENKLNVIAGSCGSGKSTLLLSLLGETAVESGEVFCPLDVAYASQSAWLQHDTIRSNILFSSPFEQARYDRVINACCLSQDFLELPLADLTILGENGVILSGGQRQRVAMARAIYSKSSLILLDDIFSALDASTAVHIYNHCFCTDLLQGRTTILVTQLPWIGRQADFEVKLAAGKVIHSQSHEDEIRVAVNDSIILTGRADEGLESSDKSATESSWQTVQNDTHPKAHPLPSQVPCAKTRTPKALVYRYLLSFGGRKGAVLILFSAFVTQVMFFSTSLWLTTWTGAYSKNDAIDVGFYLGIYAALLASSNIVTIMNNLTFQRGSWKAAQILHSQMTKAVLSVALSWYDAISIGQIINRFSRDIDSLDSLAGDSFQKMTYFCLRVLFQIVAVGSILPIFALPTATVCIIGYVVGDMYTRTASSVKRLASESQSPIFAHFSETLGGLPIVRARCGMPEIMGHQLADKLRVWATAAEVQYNLNRWVSFRTDLAAHVVALGAGLIALYRPGSVSPGMVGFSLTNVVGLSQTIIRLVRSMNQLEIELVSFQRVEEYAQLSPEDDTNNSMTPPAQWPSSGRVEFQNVTARYTLDGPDILKDVSFSIGHGERVAIVGRTGSGKSTLALSLLRVTHIMSGSIVYDGVDITHLRLEQLRQSLTIIPQDTVLFRGDVADNLDPTLISDRLDLENAFTACSDLTVLASSEDGSEVPPSRLSLTMPVTSRGQNFSHGQRQILGLARALVRKTKLVILDEATASMDYETDVGIQSVLRAELADSSLITIAHRLRTIIDYDRIIVMQGGKIVE